jgi:hypothetical protein
MLAAGTEMFLLIPEETNGRILHPGKVIESDAIGFLAEFDATIAPAVGSDVNAYGEVRGKFFQQGAKVAEIRAAEGKCVLAFSRVGDPVSAENRQTFRVSVVSANITAKVGKEKNCPVVDVSPEGFGAIAKTELRVGALVPIEFQHGGHLVSGPARVQTVKRRPDGKFRYGFLATSDRKGQARSSLQQITSLMQRAQLRRLAGAA